MSSSKWAEYDDDGSLEKVLREFVSRDEGVGYVGSR
jgi:hypothetical protein